GLSQVTDAVWQGLKLSAREAAIVELVLQGPFVGVDRAETRHRHGHGQGPSPQRLSQARHFLADAASFDLSEKPGLMAGCYAVPQSSGATGSFKRRSSRV